LLLLLLLAGPLLGPAQVIQLRRNNRGCVGPGCNTYQNPGALDNVLQPRLGRVNHRDLNTVAPTPRLRIGHRSLDRVVQPRRGRTSHQNLNSVTLPTRPAPSHNRNLGNVLQPRQQIRHSDLNSVTLPTRPAPSHNRNLSNVLQPRPRIRHSDLNTVTLPQRPRPSHDRNLGNVVQPRRQMRHQDLGTVCQPRYRKRSHKDLNRVCYPRHRVQHKDLNTVCQPKQRIRHKDLNRVCYPKRRMTHQDLNTVCQPQRPRIRHKDLNRVCYPDVKIRHKDLNTVCQARRRPIEHKDFEKYTCTKREICHVPLHEYKVMCDPKLQEPETDMERVASSVEEFFKNKRKHCKINAIPSGVSQGTFIETERYGMAIVQDFVIKKRTMKFYRWGPDSTKKRSVRKRIRTVSNLKVLVPKNQRWLTKNGKPNYKQITLDRRETKQVMLRNLVKRNKLNELVRMYPEERKNLEALKTRFGNPDDTLPPGYLPRTFPVHQFFSH
jgi:hypothetical protein